ncbi:MAG: threonine--tRNA ligase [Caldisericales bacterium]|nr:threonine--tRNA ligase [Caldisericales bacterium]
MITVNCSGKSAQIEKGSNIFQALKALELPTKNLVAAKIGDRLVDLSTILEENTSFEVISIDSPEGRDILLHSSAHLMAAAINKLFPGTKFAIGPSIKDGFYYDLDLPRPLIEEDLPKIEAEMKKISDENIKFVRKTMTKEDALAFFGVRSDNYKVELIHDIPDPTVSIYELGDFIDLCRGPHLPSSGYIKHFKLMSIAGAYWRGDEKRQMLTRIYGTSYSTKDGLEEHIKRLEEIAKRDHRILGKQLELFIIDEHVGGGLVIWQPNGAVVREIIENFWRAEHRKRGYEIVYSPHVGKADLWRTSGHLGFYADNMYPAMELETVEYYARPMNCPFHMVNYASKVRSYRDLPYRTAELGTVYRFERSGALHGLLRVRGFTQDDAHIFCTPEQLKQEVVGVVKFAIHLLETFGFKKYEIFLSTRPKEGYVGEIEKWDIAENTLREALSEMGLSFDVDEGGGAFYGPKIDIKIVDALGRPWQCTTCQFDFNNPERFDLTYTGEDGKEHRPYTIHRALLGSMERFMGCLIEHYAGAFPVWLAPTQVVIVPIIDGVLDYCRSLKDRLFDAGIRIRIDEGSDRMNAKIRNAELKKVPYVVVVGAKEAEAGKVSVRRHGKGDLGQMTTEEFEARLLAEIKERSIE